MVPGLGSVLNTVTIRGVALLLCPQPFTVRTVTLPELLLTVTVMELVVLVPVHPEGRVQI
jgi:hypothetical protein